MSSLIILVLFGMIIALFSSFVKDSKKKRLSLVENEKEDRLANKVAAVVVKALKEDTAGPEILDLDSTTD